MNIKAKTHSTPPTIILARIINCELREMNHLLDRESLAVSYTHLTLPTIYSV